MLSLGTTFAAENVSDINGIAADETSVGDVDIEPLSSVDDAAVLSDESSVVITKDNIKNYIEDNGTIKKSVNATEFIFSSGEFENLTLDIINRPITLTGNNTVLINPNITISSNNVVFQNFTVIQNIMKSEASIDAGDYDGGSRSANLTVKDSVFTFIDDKQFRSASIIDVSYTDNLKLINNVFNYVGNTNGTRFNQVILITGSNNVEIRKNKINATLPSVPIGYDMVTYDATVYSEAVCINGGDGVIFDSNDVNVTYNNASGDYDTLYAARFIADNTVISNNNLTASGNSYIYAIIITGTNFTIKSNNISSTGDYYADGIDVEGPAEGEVTDNNVDVNAQTSAYGIYSGMNGQAVKAVYKNNNITGNAYNIFAMSIGDVESELVSNRINIAGNYTTGIAYRGNKIVISNNIINLNSSEIGNEYIWEGFGVETVGIKVIQGNAVIENNSITSAGTGISLKSDSVNADLKNNTISISAHFDKDAYAVYTREISRLNMTENTISYSGATNGTGKNEALSIDADSAIIKSNKFDIDLVSIPINWVEEPAGSYNYVAYLFSEGICIEDSKSVVFDSNDVLVTCNSVVGFFDNIYAIHFKNADNAVISNNDITAYGNSYIYGIVITSNNFTIDSNDIFSIGNYYAAGIDVEGPSNGLISYNFISAEGDNSYPIYSGMNFKPVSVDIIHNDISGAGYYVVGMELGGNKATVVNNNVSVEGNYTIGIASDVSDLTVTKNNITSEASNVGNQTIYDYMGGKTLGIKVNAGKAVISENKINTTGDFAIDLTNTPSTVKNNTVQANNKTGDDAVTFNLKTSFVISTPVTVLLTKVKSGYYYNIVLKDENNNVMAKTAITVNGKTFTTDDKGAVNYKVSASKIGTQTLTIKYAGTENYNPATAVATINIVKEATKLTASKKTFKAKVKTKKYTVTLKNSKSKAIKGLKLTLKVKGKTYKATTNAKGKATFKITKLTKKGKYTAKIKFAGNGLYKAVSKSVKITVKK